MGNIRFLQLTLIGMENFAIPDQNAQNYKIKLFNSLFFKNNCDIVDYYRNKLTLNMAEALLHARRCWKTYLWCRVVKEKQGKEI